MNLQTVAQTRLQRDSRPVPGCAGLLSLGVQRRNGCEPVNTGHDNAGFNLTAAVQQTVVHILINLAQFQAHGARTTGAHELRQAVESAFLGQNGQGCSALNGLTQDDGFSNQFSFIFAELLLSFLQLSNGLFTSSGFVLLCFLLIDALCGQSDALRGTLFGLLLSLFSLCGRGNGNCSNHRGGSSGKRRSYREALGGLVFFRSSSLSHEVLNFRVLNLGSGCYRCGGLLFGFYHSGFFRSGGIEDQLGGVLLFGVEVFSLGGLRFECIRDRYGALLINSHSSHLLSLSVVFFLSKFRCQQLGRLNDGLNRLFLNGGNRLISFCYSSGEVSGFFSFSSLKNFGCIGSSLGILGSLSNL